MTDIADPGAPATGTDTTTNETTATTEPATDDDRDWKAEHDKLLAASRKWEDRAKANSQAAKELEELRKQSMTDLERAVAEAKAEGRSEMLVEVAAERVADAVRVAAAGRNVDVDALLEGINTARFVDESGQPDRKAIGDWLNKVAPAPAEQPNPGMPDLGQGGRGQPLALNGDPLEQALRNAVGAKR